MVSMKDIANACGVTMGTVSKALNDQKGVGEETKRRICEIAKKMGYFPNAQARALKTNRTYNLGVLFVDHGLSGLKHEYFSYVLDSFKKSAEEKGYDITFINCCNNENNRMSYLERCLYRGFDGVVIACVNFQNPQVLELVNSGIPVVTVDYVFQGTSAILSNNIKGMKDIMSYVYNRGHRRIAFIHGESTLVTQNRISAFYKEAENYGIDVLDEYVIASVYRDTGTAAKYTLQLLDLPTPPTCILYPDDYSAIGGMEAIRSRGLRVPEDISVVGYDGILFANRSEMNLTTIAQNTEDLGRLSAQQLISLIEKPKSTIIGQTIVDAHLIEGSTVRDLTKKM